MPRVTAKFTRKVNQQGEVGVNVDSQAMADILTAALQNLDSDDDFENLWSEAENNGKTWDTDTEFEMDNADQERRNY